MNLPNYDAILFMSFGGPEGVDDIVPFLRNVTRGRNIPDDRLAEVGEHYKLFNGVSPHNQQVKDLLGLLEPELRAHGVDLPVYWGNRNWHPLVTDTMEQMADTGVRRILAFVYAGYSSYSSCRQYRENMNSAAETLGDRAPAIDKIRVFYNHPDFVAAMQDRVAEALASLDEGVRSQARLVFTAHSIPNAMADNCRYAEQLNEACRLVAERFGDHEWSLVYQSRSGPPQVPWLEPDVCDFIEARAEDGERAAVIAPIGFLSDHLEVLYDLDTEAKQVADRLGVAMARAGTVGTHPRFVTMIRKLIQERLDPTAPREAIGRDAASHDVCPVDCCMPAARPAGRRPGRP